ncbi:phage portal protein [Lysinibacillus sp. KCTC 33748]|uniref:phage portal protein n=1 Tax=unclassified Lysinibacillus TaxID=2636778 RepID=UPI0009A90597|nr:MULTISPECIES: phage portal protein [unclassified Lysinibacillus]OXS70227.1 phage portal protein [Lysinibacillus sp. KCTC 33748]SKC04924.1 phage portal protein, HK97 family [Lysinibacillus sp. AC-3]
MWQWIKRFFKKGKLESLKDCYYELSAEYYYKKLAVEICVNLIANALSRCEIKTYKEGELNRGNMYYALNVQPNQNQNATAFFHKAIRKLIYEGESLIIMENDNFYIADSFNVKEYAFCENVYSGIQIGDLTLDRKYSESEVIRLKLTDTKILSVINELYESHGKMIEAAKSYYKLKNNKRVLIKGDFLRPQDDEAQEAIDDMFENQLKNWFDPDKKSVAFQLQEGFEIEDMSDSKTGLTIDSRDISNLVDDIFNYVAMAFHVPRGLLKGDLADIDKQTDNFIMFALNPPAEMMEDEFNRKSYSKDEYLNRTYLKIDTSKIKITDIVQLATAFDKMFAIGVYTINDILSELGHETIDDEIADKRHVTKNYQDAETALKGGET